MWFTNLMLACLLSGSAQPAPASLSFDSPRVSPGKLDFLARHDGDTGEYNLIWWTPMVKGGAGLLDPETGGSTKYAGMFVRPLVATDCEGELILGAQLVDTPTDDAFELQGEYRWNSGLGVGAGMVERANSDNDTWFAKVTYRSDYKDWKYIVAGQFQEVGDETKPGGYAALYDERLMLVLGSDGEQWRTAAGFVAPKRDSPIRPAAEILYVDNTIGYGNGPRFLFANATLGFRGGFLSHPARLGRAMGPQGLEYGNPLGFLRPTWNRRLNVWELGSLMNYRLVRLDFPDGTESSKHELVIFPASFERHAPVWQGFFVGASRASDLQGRSWGLIGGFIGKVGPLQLGASVEHRLDPDTTTIVVGLIDKF